MALCWPTFLRSDTAQSPNARQPAEAPDWTMRVIHCKPADPDTARPLSPRSRQLPVVMSLGLHCTAHMPSSLDSFRLFAALFSLLPHPAQCTCTGICMGHNHDLDSCALPKLSHSNFKYLSANVPTMQGNDERLYAGYTARGARWHDKYSYLHQHCLRLLLAASSDDSFSFSFHLSRLPHAE